MCRRPLLFITLLALVALAPTAAIAKRTPAHTKKQAEVNVLRVVASKWTARRLPGLVNRRTHLLADNTEAICHGRGTRRAGNRYPRFVCVVRPNVHTARQGLFVSYRALPRKHFTIRWLAYRRR
jgi:hypothetical protein